MNTPAHVTTRPASITATRLAMRHRDGTIALDDVTLSVEPGLLTAVIGPSGAGSGT